MDAKASDSGATTARRPSLSSVDSFRTRGRDASRRGRGSSDDEAAAKPFARRKTGSPESRAAGTERRENSDTGSRCVVVAPSAVLMVSGNQLSRCTRTVCGTGLSGFLFHNFFLCRDESHSQLTHM